MSSPDISRSSGGIDSAQFYRSKLPPNAPEILVQNTVEVSHPAQVLPWYRDERQRQFHLLVKRLVTILGTGSHNFINSR